jgi:hypothetical protein
MDEFLAALRAMAKSFANANQSLPTTQQNQDLAVTGDKRLIFASYDPHSGDLDWWSVSGSPNTGPGGTPATTIYRQIGSQQVYCVDPSRWAYYDSGLFRFHAYITVSTLSLSWKWTDSGGAGVGCY